MSSQPPPQMPPPPAKPPPPEAVSSSGPNSLPQTWKDPATGYSYYWDGNQWVPHGTANGPTSTSPSDGAKGSRGGALNGLKWFVSIAGVLVVVVALGYAMSRGQDVKDLDVSSGKVTFYSGGDGGIHSGDVSNIEASQNSIARRVDQLEADAASVSLDVPVASAANFTGTWVGDNGATYAISQFGDTAVIQEQSVYGITAYGEGSVDGSTASMRFTAFDGSIGTALLEMTNADRIAASFDNLTYGTSFIVDLDRL